MYGTPWHNLSEPGDGFLWYSYRGRWHGLLKCVKKRLWNKGNCEKWDCLDDLEDSEPDNELHDNDVYDRLEQDEIDELTAEIGQEQANNNDANPINRTEQPGAEEVPNQIAQAENELTNDEHDNGEPAT